MAELPASDPLMANLRHQYSLYDLKSPNASAALQLHDALLDRSMPSLMAALDRLDGHAPGNTLKASGLTPLMLASSANWEHGMAALIDAGADLDEPWHACNAMLHALGQENLGAMALLAKFGARLDLQDGSRRACLHFAASAQDPEVFRLLVSMPKADDMLPLLDALDMAWETPLATAAIFGHSEAMAWLLSRGAKVDLGDRRGNTPLHHAIDQGRVACARLLIAAGADMRHENDGHDDALLAALRSGSPCVEALLEAGADPRHRTSIFTTAAAASLASAGHAAELIRAWSDALDLRDAVAQSCPAMLPSSPSPSL